MRKWLTDRFLPLWAKETVLRENRQLTAENAALRQQIRELESCIRGIRLGMRKRRQT